MNSEQTGSVKEQTGPKTYLHKLINFSEIYIYTHTYICIHTYTYIKLNIIKGGHMSVSANG